MPEPSDELALFPLGTVLVPGALLRLQIFEPRYVRLLEDLQQGTTPGGHRGFGVVGLRTGVEIDIGQRVETYEVGCLAEPMEITAGSDGVHRLVLRGTRVFRCEGQLDNDLPYLSCKVAWRNEPPSTTRTAVLAARAHRLLVEYALTSRYRPADGVEASSGPDEVDPADPVALSYRIADAVVADLSDRQEILAAEDTDTRLRCGIALLARELMLLRTLNAWPHPDITRLVTPSAN